LKFGWNIRPDPAALEPLQKDFKLLKFLILRVTLQLDKLYHKVAIFEPSEKYRIEGVTGLFIPPASAGAGETPPRQRADARATQKLRAIR
jgi:hypothetical protein